MMHRALIPFVLATAYAGTFAATGATPAWDHTIAEIVVPLGAPTARAEFPFVATAPAPTVITEVRVSCGCLAVEWPRDPLRAGQRAALSVVFTPGERSGRHEFSLFVFRAGVAAPDELRLVTQVTPLLELSQRVVIWERATPPIARVVEVRAAPGVTLAAPEGDTAQLRFDLARHGDDWRLRLEPTFTAHPFTARVRLTATPVGQPPQVFTIIARVP